MNARTALAALALASGVGAHAARNPADVAADLAQLQDVPVTEQQQAACDQREAHAKEDAARKPANAIGAALGKLGGSILGGILGNGGQQAGAEAGEQVGGAIGGKKNGFVAGQVRDECLVEAKQANKAAGQGAGAAPTAVAAATPVPAPTAEPQEKLDYTRIPTGEFYVANGAPTTYRPLGKSRLQVKATRDNDGTLYIPVGYRTSETQANQFVMMVPVALYPGTGSIDRHVCIQLPNRSLALLHLDTGFVRPTKECDPAFQRSNGAGDLFTAAMK